MRVVAIIPARGGSKGVPGKNKRLLAGIPLVSRSIRAARSAKLVNAVYVSTDDLEIAQISEEYGAIALERPAEISGSKASSESALLHALQVIENGGAAAIDVVVFLQCTSPFTTPDQIDLVVSELLEKNADCAFSAVEDHGFLWSIDESGIGRGVNHDDQRPRKRRQDLPVQLRETGAIYALNCQSFKKIGSRFCGKTIPVSINADPLEIDTQEDWDRAEALAWHAENTRLAAPCWASLLSGIRAIVTDFDGVHTDDRVIVDQDGREAVICSRRDGMGIERLRIAGHRMLILSKETNPVVARRAEKLGIEVVHGCQDKAMVLSRWLAEQCLEWRQLIFVGNDINDVECMKNAAISFCPIDGHREALNVADFILPNKGGDGALRAMADVILKTSAG